MPIKFQIIKDLQLMYTVFSGDVDATDALDYARDIYNANEIESARNTLVYLKGCRLKYKVDDVEAFGRKIINNKKFINRDRIAILISNPSDTVAATIFANTVRSNRRKIIIELFYTLEAALDFMDLSEHKKEIDELIYASSSIEN